MPDRALQDQFGTPARQLEAAQLGMWIFLATEVLFFGVLFAGYAEYRYLYSDGFHAAGRHVDDLLGLVLTLVLVSASGCAAAAVQAIRHDRSRAAGAWLLGAAFLGATFIALHLWEYAHHAREGALPGEWYHFEKATEQGASVFFTLYWLLTGLHVLHVTVGVVTLVALGFAALAGRYGRHYHTPLELGTLYWHFVDVVWLFLFPLFYFVR